MQIYKLPFNCSRKELIKAAMVGFGICEDCKFRLGMYKPDITCKCCARNMPDLYVKKVVK